MSGVYEELEGIFGDREEGGLSTMALVSLPPKVRSVVWIMLRHKGEVAYPDLLEAVQGLSEEKRVSQAELDEILDAMIRLNLVIRSQHRRTTAYKVNLGTTTGGTRSASAPDDATGDASVDAIWDALDAGGVDAEEEGGFFGGLLRSLGLK